MAPKMGWGSKAKKRKMPLRTNTTANQKTGNAAASSDKENVETAPNLNAKQVAALLADREQRELLKPTYNPDNDASDKQLAVILADNYQSYSIEKMEALEKKYGLRHVDFVDLVMGWIASGKYTQDQVMQVWGKVRKSDLELWYYYYLTKSFDSEHRNSNFGKMYRLPDGMLRIKHKYERECFVINELCGHNLAFLFNKETVVFFNKCDVCGRKYDVQLRLTDEQPCYDLTQEKHAHSDIYHWYLVYEEQGTCRLWNNGTEYNTYYSLVTNTRTQVIAKIKELMSKGKEVGLYCMYQCRGAKFTKALAKGHSHGPPQMVD